MPVLYIAIRATEHGWQPIRTTLWRSGTADLLGRSLGLAATVAVACALLGVAAAWLVASTDVPFKPVLRVALALPLALPSYVAGWAWIGWRPGLAGFWGAAIVLTTVSYPYVYLPVLAAFRRVDPALAEQARAAGMGPTRTFVATALPQIRIAVLGGSLLVTLYVLSEFGAVSIMRYQTLTKAIYESYRAAFDRTPAAILGLLLVLLTALPLLGASHFSERDRVAKVGSGAARQPAAISLGRWRWLAVAVAVTVVGVSLGVPAANLLVWLQQGQSRTTWSEVGAAMGTTLWLALLTAAVTVAVAFPVGYLSARYPGRLSRRLTTVAYTGHALPGVVIALSLVFFGVRFLGPIYQRTPMLVGGYLVLFLSLAIGSIHASIALAPAALDDVARSLGASPPGVWARVTAPLAAPGLGAAATLVCVATMKELPATLLLRPIGMETLATRLWSETDNGSYAAAAPYAAALVLLAAVPTAFLTRANLRERR